MGETEGEGARVVIPAEQFDALMADNDPDDAPGLTAIGRDLPAALASARGKVPYSPSGTLPGEYWRGYTAAIEEVRALLAEHPAQVEEGVPHV